MSDGRAPADDAGRIRVLHLINGLSFGGAEQLLLSISRVRDRDRFDYHMAHVRSDLDDLVEALLHEDVLVHDLGARSAYDLRWLGRLRRLLTGDRFDVLHVHLPYASAFGRIVARSLPRPARPAVVHTQHNVWRHTTLVVRALDRLTSRLDAADVAVSRSAWAALPPSLQRRTEVVVHGVVPDDIPTANAVREDVRAQFGVAPDDVLITTVANLRTEKGYDVLLPAAAQLVGEGLPVRFLAVGHGHHADDILALHAKLGLGERFVLTGFRDDVLRLVAGSDLFVLASHHEGFPVAVMEALAAGVPVVATAVGDIPDAVRSGTEGLVVPPGDASALADAIRTLVTEPGVRQRMAAAAREAGLRFDIRAATRRNEEIYRMLRGSGR